MDFKNWYDLYATFQVFTRDPLYNFNVTMIDLKKEMKRGQFQYGT